MPEGTTIIRETDNSSTIIVLIIIIVACVIAWFYFNKDKEEEQEELGCEYEIDEIIDEEHELWGKAVPDTRIDMNTIRVSAITTSTKRIPYA